MSGFDELLLEIDKGRRGEVAWIPIGFNKIGRHIGIGRRIYTLIGGMAGTGKTAFTDLAYVIKPYQWLQENKDKTDVQIRWIYRSMERNSVYKQAKWVSYKLWMDYKILMDVPTILSWGTRKSNISDELYELIKKTRDYFEEMFDYVEVIDGPINPTGIYKHVKEYALVHGEIIEEPYTTKDGIKRNRKKYIPKNDNLITIIIEDHIGKCKGEKVSGVFYQNQSKQILDKMSDYNASEFRDFYGFSPVAVMQFNRGLEGNARSAQLSKNQIESGPLPTDFKGSGNVYEDSDVAMALYNPFKVKDYDHMDYDINQFVNSKGYNRFRSLTILKNSYGIDDVCYGLNFLGECGGMRELPKATEIDDYRMYAEVNNKNSEYGL